MARETKGEEESSALCQEENSTFEVWEVKIKAYECFFVVGKKKKILLFVNMYSSVFFLNTYFPFER